MESRIILLRPVKILLDGIRNSRLILYTYQNLIILVRIQQSNGDKKQTLAIAWWSDIILHGVYSQNVL